MASLWKHVVGLMCLGIAASTAYSADGKAVSTAASVSGIVDVTLTQTGGLTGRYLDGEGHGVDGAIVVVAQGDRIIAKTNTAPSGAYHVEGLRPGAYQLTMGNQSQTVRAWNAQAAPPSSRRLVTTVRNDQIVRGQFGIIGGTLGSTIGAVGGVAGAGAGGFAVVESQDARDDADAAMKEAAELREMMHHLMSP